MKMLTRSVTAVILLSLLFACKKSGPTLSPREEQEKNEQTTPLKENEILEQEGIRFILNYNQDQADIHLRLYKGKAGELVPVDLKQEQPFVNYSILASQMEENSDYTLVVEYPDVVTAGSFDVAVIGFTDLNTTKRFTISATAFAPSNKGSAKNFMNIRKGLRKYTFTGI